ncbi:MAG: class I SAM-dependent methyltransferase [Patescibacteria group bacterium]
MLEDLSLIELDDEFWTFYAQIYDKGTATLFGYRQLLEMVIGRLRLQERSRVVDAGCGTFNYGLAVLERVPKAWIIGLEKNPAMIRVAHAKLGSGLEKTHVLCHDLDKEPWPRIAKNADVILSVNSLYALNDPVDFLTSVFEALNPGGQLLLVNLSNPSTRAVLEAHDKWLRTEASESERFDDASLAWARDIIVVMNQHIARISAGSALHVLAPDDLARLVKNAGLKINELIPSVYNGTCVLIDAEKPQ